MKYIARLVSNLMPLSSVVTRITFEKATSKTGKPYALFNFDAIHTLTQDEAVTAKIFANQFAEIMNVNESVRSM